MFCRKFKNIPFGSNFWFLHWWNILYFIWKFGTDKVSILQPKYLEKWSQRDFTDVNLAESAVE